MRMRILNVHLGNRDEDCTTMTFWENYEDKKGKTVHFGGASMDR